MPKALSFFLLLILMIVVAAVVSYLVESLAICMGIGFLLGFFVYAPIVQNILKSK